MKSRHLIEADASEYQAEMDKAVRRLGGTGVKPPHPLSRPRGLDKTFVFLALFSCADWLFDWAPSWFFYLFFILFGLPFIALACIEYAIRFLLTPRKYWDAT